MHVKDWIDNGIVTIGQLIEESGNFLSFDAFQERFGGVNTNFLTYLGIIEAIKRYKLMTGLEFSNEDNTNGCSKVWSCLKRGGTKYYYSLLLNKVVQPPCIKKWEEMFLNSTFNWEKIFQKPFKTTFDSQLRWFQLRVLHRRIPTKQFLCLCKISPTPLCPFCNNHEESILHMLWSCPLSQKFWSDLTALINLHCEHAVNFVCDEMLIVFGVSNRTSTDSVMDLLILLAKFYLYKNKMLNTAPNVKAFMRSLRNRYIIEKYRHTVNGQEEQAKFHINWLPYQNFLEICNGD